MTSNTLVLNECLSSIKRILSYHEADFMIVIETKDGEILSSSSKTGYEEEIKKIVSLIKNKGLNLKPDQFKLE